MGLAVRRIGAEAGATDSIVSFAGSDFNYVGQQSGHVSIDV